LADAQGRIVDQRGAGVHHLAQIVRRNIGRHADGDAGGAVDQQIRQAGGKNGRLALRLVVVGDKIDRFLVDVGQQFVGDPRHPNLGVTHRRRGVV